MTTVTIGTYPKIPVTEMPAEKPREARELPAEEEREAYVSARSGEERLPEPEEAPVRVFSSPVSVRRRLRFRAVAAVQLLLAAGAGLFVWLGSALGSAELRAAIAEAAERALHG